MTKTFDKLPKTAKELIEISEAQHLSVHEVIGRVRELEIEARNRVEIPEYKSKPNSSEFYKKSSSPTPGELRTYADAVEEYEKYEKKRNAAIHKQRNSVPNMGEVLEGFIRHASGLNDIPKQYQDKVYRHAWESGHSAGYTEVYIHLQELVEIFN